MILGVVMVPVYIRYMGAEAYGIIGFYTVLQVWFSLLDIGFTPTMARETARYRGGVNSALNLRRQLRAFEVIFSCVAIFGGIAMILLSGIIAGKWLKVESLQLDQVRNALILVAIILTLRCVSSLYRSTITGFERLIWLGGFNFTISTLRYLLVVPLFIIFPASIEVFFCYQLIVAIIELAILITKTHLLMPRVENIIGLFGHWESLRGTVGFSLSVAFTSNVWILVTQTDKLILSNLLSLSDYAFFTLAVLAASGVTFICVPINAALVPRLTKLAAQNDETDIIHTYRGATQLVCLIAVPTTLVLALFAHEIIFVWTGDAEIAKKAAPVLTLYALGNGFLSLGSFPYFLQIAKGNLRFHIVGSSLYLVILIPTIIWATLQYGVVGAGTIWLIINALYFFIWPPIVHQRFFKGFHFAWLMRDIAPIVTFSSIIAVMMRSFIKWPNGRIYVLLCIVTAGIILLIVSSASSSFARERLTGRLLTRFAE